VGSVPEGERDTFYSAYQILSTVMFREHYLCREMHLLRLTSGYSGI